MQFRMDIQGLRAVAFLLVFIFHLDKGWLSGGYLGVDLFFVISGYLITTIILSDIEHHRFSFFNFFEKRFKRILPAYFGYLLSVAFFGAFVWLYRDIDSFTKALIQSGSFVSNVYFSQGESYFGAKLSENPLLHTWSLSLEMQFYLLLPFVIFFFRHFLLPVLLILVVLLTIYSSYEIYFLDNQQKIYFSLISRIPEFLIGSVYAIIFKNGVDLSRVKNNFIAIVSLSMLIFCAYFYTEDTSFPGVLALFPCVAGANILVMRNNIITEFLSCKVLVFIGELSYSLYLWHWGIMAFVRYANDSYDFSAVQMLFVVVVTFVLSYVSYYLLEKRFRRKDNFHFAVVFVPVLVVFFVFSTQMKHMGIVASRQVPDKYARPLVGLKSHYENQEEKMGDLSKNDKIILIGDSHALMLKPFLDTLGKEYHFSFNTLTCSVYPAIEGIKREEVPNNRKNFYDYSRKLIPHTKKMIADSEIIIINSVGFERLPSMKVALKKLASELKSNQKLILIKTFPKLNKNPLKQYKTFISIGGELKNRTNPKNEKILKEIVQKYPNVYMYDISKSDIFATPGYINGIISYYDNSHINHYGAMQLTRDLGQDFMQFFDKIKNN